MTNPTDIPERSLNAARYELTFPERDSAADQDSEFCEVRINGDRRRIRFHDYPEIYSIPGLYEQLFYDETGFAVAEALVEHRTRKHAGG